MKSKKTLIATLATTSIAALLALNPITINAATKSVNPTQIQKNDKQYVIKNSPIQKNNNQSKSPLKGFCFVKKLISFLKSKGNALSAKCIYFINYYLIKLIMNYYLS